MPILVRPEEWVKLTAVTIGKRHSDLIDIDKAYKEYFFDKSLGNAMILKQALDNYLARHNTADWSRIERNVKSKGKMKQVHDLVKMQIGNRTEEQIAADDRARIAKLMLNPSTRAQQALLSDADQTRLGVLYLLANTDASADYLKVFLEGSMSVVSNVTADYSPAISSADETGQAVAGFTTTTTAVVSAASSAIVDKGRAKFGKKKPKYVTPAAWARIDALLDAGKNPATKAGTPERKAEQETEGTLMKYARKAVNWMAQNERTTVSLSETVILSIVKAATKYVMVNGLPIVGALTDITQGVAKAAAAAGPIVQQHMLKKKFDIQSGHPQILADTIESQMKWAIGKGLFSALKGGMRAGLIAVSLGAAALGEIIAAAIEFITKAVYRLYESLKMKIIFAQARRLYAECKWIVHVPDEVGRTRECAFPKPGSLVTNRKAFTEQFEEWCDSCPCVAMLTLNSGICGDLMQMMRMFESATTTVSNDAFHAGAEYFNNLKYWSARYLKDSGFIFSSRDPFVAKLLDHACGKHGQGGKSHAEPTMSKWQRLGAFLGA